MNSTAPVFSIIIATHNRPSLLDRALRSVRAQTYLQHQLIVISDVHDPASYEVAARAMAPGDIFIERMGAPGPAQSRNLGLSLVRGNYFIFLDDDDSFASDFLENCAAQLRAIAPDNLASQFFYTNFEVVNEHSQGSEIIVTQTSRIDSSVQAASSVYVKNFVPNNCLIYPGVLAGNIAFDPAIAYEDWDFILSAYGTMPLQHLPLYGPKIHKNAGTESEQRGKSNDAGLLQCYLTVYSKHPSPNPQIAGQRHDLFASLGLDLEALLQTTSGSAPSRQQD